MSQKSRPLHAAEARELAANRHSTSNKKVGVSFAKDKAFHWALIAQHIPLVISVRGYVVNE